MYGPTPNTFLLSRTSLSEDRFGCPIITGLFYLDCGTTSSLSYYGTCHIPGLTAKISIVKRSPIINDIIQPNMLNWILSILPLLLNTLENIKIFEITWFQYHILSFSGHSLTGSHPTSPLALCFALASLFFLPLPSEWGGSQSMAPGPLPSPPTACLEHSSTLKTLLYIYITSLLEYNCFTMVC